MKRIAQIDGLRAVASLMVMSFHYISCQITNAKSLPLKLIEKVFSFGWVGVDLFFVLSGFLIGSILITNKNKENYFTTFYVRRLVRIIPNYYLLIVLFISISFIPYFKDDYFLTGNLSVPTWSYFTMFQNVFMGMAKNMGNPAMSVTWSIGIEEQFYLVIPFIIYFINKKYLPHLLVLLIIAANLIRYYYYDKNIAFNIPSYVLLPCRMDALSLGILIAILNDKIGIEQFFSTYKKYLFISLIGVCFFCASMYILFHDLGILKHTLFALFFSIIITISLGSKNTVLTKFLSNKILTWFGKISYSLYLFHFLILGIVKNIASKNLTFTQEVNFLVASIVALLITIIFSWLVYKYLETPMVSIGKKFQYK